MTIQKFVLSPKVNSTRTRATQTNHCTLQIFFSLFVFYFFHVICSFCLWISNDLIRHLYKLILQEEKFPAVVYHFLSRVEKEEITQDQSRKLINKTQEQLYKKWLTQICRRNMRMFELLPSQGFQVPSDRFMIRRVKVKLTLLYHCV